MPKSSDDVARSQEETFAAVACKAKIAKGISQKDSAVYWPGVVFFFTIAAFASGFPFVLGAMAGHDPLLWLLTVMSVFPAVGAWAIALAVWGDERCNIKENVGKTVTE